MYTLVLALLWAVPSLITAVPDHGSRLASGTYTLYDAAGVEAGAETFELYRGTDEGLVAHSTVNTRGTTIETWASIDRRHSADAAEVVYLQPDGARTTVELFREGDDWVAQFADATRGGRKVRQTVDTRGRLALVTPATVTLGWPMLLPSGRQQAWVIPPLPHSAGWVTTIAAWRFGPKMFRLPDHRELSGEVVKLSGLRVELLLYSRYRVPLWARLADGSERRLTKFSGALPEAELVAALTRR